MKKSLQSLLEGIVDYAGLFPPAQLTMLEAVANYARYRKDDTAWMLGRFILPLARLDEFAAARDVVDAANDTGASALLSLSVLGSGDLALDFDRITRFNIGEDAANKERRCVIDALEFKPSSVADIRLSAKFKHENQIAARDTVTETAKRASQFGVEVFCEVPVGEDADALLDEIAEAGVSGKVRTGGTSADMFPAAHDLARFIHGCSQRGIAFKATAGLHHPLRANHALTYEPDAPRGMMFGFLNVFITAAFARAGSEPGQLVEILETSSATDFTFTHDSLAWRNQHLKLPAIEAARRNFAISFGSCSFTEPIADLKALNLL